MIEREAVAAERERIRTEIEALPKHARYFEPVERRDVLAVVDDRITEPRCPTCGRPGVTYCNGCVVVDDRITEEDE
jgi:hypothetical protein